MLCISIILIAVVFKVMHFAGAGILLVIGLGSMSLLFIPISYFLLLKSTEDKLLKLVFHAAFISFSLDFIGMLFKIMHWPGTGWLLIIGLPLPFILFLPAYINYHNKRKLKTDTDFFAILLFMIYLGVFTSLLAVNSDYLAIEAYAHSTNEISESNSFLIESTTQNLESPVSVSTNEMVKRLENIKKSLVMEAGGGNKEFVQLDGTINYRLISGKKNGNVIAVSNMDYIKFNQQFEEFAKMLKANMVDNNTQRLIDEINVYRLAKMEGQNPTIMELPLITVLNVLTDWQNKLLLINYTQKQSSI